MDTSFKARKSRELDSRKDSQQTKLNRKPWTLVKLSFRELCDSKLSGNIAISLSCQMCENHKGKLWVNDNYHSLFCESHWKLIYFKKLYQTLETPTWQKITIFSCTNEGGPV